MTKRQITYCSGDYTRRYLLCKATL